jgi:hypothetical protein
VRAGPRCSRRTEEARPHPVHRPRPTTTGSSLNGSPSSLSSTVVHSRTEPQRSRSAPRDPRRVTSSTAMSHATPSRMHPSGSTASERAS